MISILLYTIPKKHGKTLGKARRSDWLSDLMLCC